jgi:predicted RNase H-like HicB family nuclease
MANATISRTDVAASAAIAGRNGQGKAREQCLERLAAALELVLEYRREQSLEKAPRGAGAATLREARVPVRVEAHRDFERALAAGNMAPRRSSA